MAYKRIFDNTGGAITTKSPATSPLSTTNNPINTTKPTGYKRIFNDAGQPLITPKETPTPVTVKPVFNQKEQEVQNLLNKIKTQNTPAIQPIVQVPAKTYKNGLPESTISAAPKIPSLGAASKPEGFWTKAAKAVLPKSLEDYFGLNSNEAPTGKELVKQSEDAKQSYFRTERKEANVKAVTKQKEEYTAPTGFVGQAVETVKMSGYSKSIITGYFMPALGTVAEQAGVSMDIPKLRAWGEKFADQKLYENTLTKEGQSMADVKPALEGGLLDPRYYAKTVSQAIGFFGAILGSSVAVTAMTKNPVAGTVAGYGVGASLESAGAYQDMIDSGVNPDDANDAAQIYGVAASIIENATGLKPAEAAKGMIKDFAVDAVKRKGIKEFFKTWAEEGAEEGAQQLVQNLIQKWVNKDQKITDNVLESIVGGLVGALPLVGGTNFYSSYKAKQNTKTTEITTPATEIQPAPNPLENQVTPETPAVPQKNTAEEIVSARDVLTNGRGNVDLSPSLMEQKLNVVQNYQTEMASPAVEILNTDKSTLADIKVVQYPDMRWGFSYEINTASNGISSDFLSNPLFNTREEAVTKAKEELINYANSEMANVNEDVQAEFKDIIGHVQEVDVKDNTPMEISKNEKEVTAPEVVSEEATVDWETNYAEKYGVLAGQADQISKEIKIAPKAEIAGLQSSLDKIVKEQSGIEREWVEKWQEKPEGKETPQIIAEKMSAKGEPYNKIVDELVINHGVSQKEANDIAKKAITAKPIEGLTGNKYQDKFIMKLTDKYPDKIVLYHQTTKSNVDSILKNGLKPKDNLIYFVLGAKSERATSSKNGVNLKITLPIKFANELYPEDGTYYTPEVGDDADLFFKNYMKDHPDLTGGDVVIDRAIPAKWIEVEKIIKVRKQAFIPHSPYEIFKRQLSRISSAKLSEIEDTGDLKRVLAANNISGEKIFQAFADEVPYKNDEAYDAAGQTEEDVFNEFKEKLLQDRGVIAKQVVYDNDQAYNNALEKHIMEMEEKENQFGEETSIDEINALISENLEQNLNIEDNFQIYEETIKPEGETPTGALESTARKIVEPKSEEIENPEIAKAKAEEMTAEMKKPIRQVGQAGLDLAEPGMGETNLFKQIDKQGGGSESAAKGQSNKGTFTENTPVLGGTLDKIRPIQTPEMVELVREITGNVPTINKRLRTARGKFLGKKLGEIQLKPDIFNDPVQVAKTLAHEIGHLTDWLPQDGKKRSTLFQKLYTLKGHLKNEFGEDVKNKDIRKELFDLSVYWRPLGENPTAGFLKYRRSGNELYADAISVLFNSPGLLEQKAPIFYKQFFESLDQKSDINEKYWEIQDLLFGAKEQLFEAREARIKQGFLKASDIQKQLREKKDKADRRLGERLKQQLDNRYYPALKKIQAAEKAGVIIDDSANPKYLFQELSFINNDNYLLVEKLDREVSKPIAEAGMNDDDIGFYLLLKRISTERKDIANPYGFDVNTAQEQLDYLKQRVGEENFKLLEEKIKLFHDEVFKSVEKAVEVGAYNKELFETTIKPNKDTYATFAVVDYLQDYVPATVKKQVGTFKEVANPYHLTILKTAALNKLNAKQETTTSFLNFLKTQNPEDIKPSGEIKTGKVSIFKRSTDTRLSGQIKILEDGKLKSYDVDPYIAKSFESENPDSLNVAVKALSYFNNKFKSIVTTYNLGFAAIFNPIRDLKRNYKLIPNANIIPVRFSLKKGIEINTAGNLLIQYAKSLPSAFRFAKGNLDDFTRQMVADKLMNAPINDYNYDPRSDEMGAILEKYGVIEKQTPERELPVVMKQARQFVLKPLIKVLDAMRFTANTFEVVSKIAGTKIRQSGGERGKLLAYNVRNYTGTPNWKVKGIQTNTTNEVFIFSNIMKEGIKSDFQIAFNPTTRSGYWWKTMKVDFLPKMLMFAATLGLFGDALKKMFDDMSEYDKTNYITIPIGYRNGKTVYMRIPHDETGRLFSAVLWKVMKLAQTRELSGMRDIASLGAGQLPSITPLATLFEGWVQYGTGKNPYDSFRGRLLMDDTTFQAGGLPALTKMVQWSLNTVGLSQFTTYDPSKNDTVETLVQILPGINRLFKISNYGVTEQSMKIQNEMKTEKAKETIKDKAVINDLILKYKDDYTSGKIDQYTLGDMAVEKLLGHYPETEEEFKRDTSIRSRLKKSLIIGTSDSRIDSLVYSTSNKEKVALLKKYEAELDPSQFDELINTLYDEKIVSDDVLSEIGR